MHQISLFASNIVSEVRYEESQTRIHSDLPEGFDPGYSDRRDQNYFASGYGDARMPSPYAPYHDMMAGEQSATPTSAADFPLPLDPRYGGSVDYPTFTTAPSTSNLYAAPYSWYGASSGPPGPGIRWDDPCNPGIYGDTRPSERPREVSGEPLNLSFS